MPDDTQDVTPSQPSLDELLAQIVAADEAGQPIEGELLAAKHPQFAADLREFVANRDRMQQLAAPLRNAGPQAGGNNGHPRDKIRYFGDYELIEEIAAGGMGIVYKARQVSLNRIVAVKMILRGSLATEDDVKRFRAEAEAAANLQHPGIVAIHEVGIHEGQHYFSMDYVDGQSLGQLPREKPLSARQAAEYVREAAVAVHAAHQQGTLHRDLKPSNILIDRQGRVRITDFGLAKRIEGNSDLTITGQILGTPSYMPPEQALGKRSLIGTASDVYSLGAVLYELLAGRPPFRGESPAETLRQVETLDPISPRLLNPTTPRDLETICLKCLDKEPHKRYATAQLLADDLSRFLRHEPILARPISRFSRVWRWCRRNPVVATLATTTSVALAVAIAALSISNLKVSNALADRTEALRNLGQQQQETRAALDRERNLVADKTRLLAERDTANAKLKKSLDQQQQLSYYHLIDLAWREHQAGRASNSKGFLDDCPRAMRGWEWYYLNSGGYRLLSATKTGVQFPHRTAAFSRDGQLVASIVHFDGDKRTQEPIRIWDPATGQELFRFAVSTPRPIMEFDVAFDPLGKTLAVATDRMGVDLIDIKTGKILKTFSTGGSAYRAQFSEDGKYLLAAHSRGATVWNLDSGNEVRSFDTGDRCCGATFNQRATQIVTGNGVGEVAIWELSTGNKLAKLNDDPKSLVEPPEVGLHRYCNAVIFSPDYQQIAAAFASGRAIIWNAKSHERILTLKGHNHWIYNISYNHNGTRIVTAGRDGSIKLWDSNTFREILTLHSHEGRVFCAVISPDDQHMVSTADDGTIRIWDAQRFRRPSSTPLTTSSP